MSIFLKTEYESPEHRAGVTSPDFVKDREAYIEAGLKDGKIVSRVLVANTSAFGIVEVADEAAAREWRNTLINLSHQYRIGIKDITEIDGTQFIIQPTEQPLAEEQV